jgi:hypothetical protein
VGRLRTDLRTTQNHHDDRRHQLDLQIAEIEDLRREIAWRDEELAQERRKGEAGSELAGTVNALEKEVDRVRADAEMFSHELKALRDSRDDLELVRREEASRAERVQMQLKAQVRVLDEQAEEHRSRIRRLVEELESHVCVAGYVYGLHKIPHAHHTTEVIRQSTSSNYSTVMSAKGLWFRSTISKSSSLERTRSAWSWHIKSNTYFFCFRDTFPIQCPSSPRLLRHRPALGTPDESGAYGALHKQ